MHACTLSYFGRVQLYGLQLARLLGPWDSLGKSSRVGCHALLQWIFPTQGLHPCLLHLTCIGRRVLYHQCHLGNKTSTAKLQLTMKCCIRSSYGWEQDNNVHCLICILRSKLL